MRFAPWRRAVLAHDQIELTAAQGHAFCRRFDQREAQPVLVLASAGGRELLGAEIDADGSGAGPGEGGRQERGAAAELGDVEPAHVTEQSQVLLGLTEQAPSHRRLRPAALGVSVGDLLVDHRPHFALSSQRVATAPVHGRILPYGEASPQPRASACQR